MANGHQVETQSTAHFRHDYSSDQANLRRLYEQAKIDQWNAAKDIDWAVPLEGDGGLISDDLVDIQGTRFWDRMSAADRIELNRRVTRWRLSTLVQGEHGAMLLCSQLVDCVQGQDAKLFQATQVVDWSHASQRLWLVANTVLGEQSPAARAWANAQLDRLWQGEVTAVTQNLVALDLDRATWPAEVREAPGYFEHNQPRMRYADFRAAGVPIGSGTVESAANTVVHHRLLRPGRGWTRQNAQAMLAGLSELHSDRFAEAWQASLPTAQ